MANKIFKNNLNFLINEKKSSQAELARFVNCATETVNFWFKEGRVPRSDEHKNKIAEFFNVPIEHLFFKDLSLQNNEQSAENYSNQQTVIGQNNVVSNEPQVSTSILGKISIKKDDFNKEDFNINMIVELVKKGINVEIV